MIFKSYLIEKDLTEIQKFKAVLLYGENDGLKDNLKQNLKIMRNQTEIINFFQDEIIKNKDLLLNEVNNSSLFSSNRTFIIHDATDKIFEKIQEIVEDQKAEDKIIILSNILDKKSKLRNFFESSKDLAVVPCYQDNEISLSNYIRTQLNDFKGLSTENINIIINNSNQDRRIINNEIDKIKTLFIEKNIDKEKLIMLLNIKSNSSFDKIRDASLLGDLVYVNKSLSSINVLNEDVFFFLNQLSLRINKLLEIHKLSKDYKNSDIALENIKPKIFWKDKQIVKNQIHKLNESKLSNILGEIGEAELLMKKGNKVRNDIIVKNLIVNICNSANAIS